MKILFHWLVTVAWATLMIGCTGLAKEPGVGRPIRIVMIGDSITQGGHQKGEFTYRWPLFKMLVDGGYDFDFIGSQQQGLDANFSWPDQYKGVPFDADHEGVYGIKTTDALKRLPQAMEHWPAAPDIALIHLGTNDQSAEDHAAAVKEPLRQMIALLRQRNPRIVILLGHLNFNGGVVLEKMRPLIDELAAEENTGQSPVIAVKHYEGWHADPEGPQTDTYDWAHPNAIGQEKMAAHWFDAMRPYLTGSRRVR